MTPMRVLLATVGSTGDLNPFLALGKALARAGHEVVVLTNRFHKPRIAAAGLAFRDYSGARSPDDYEPMLRTVMAMRSPVRQGAAIFEYSCRDMVASMAATSDAVRWADVVVAHGVHFGAIAACERLSRRLVTVHLFPTLLRSRALNPTGRSFGTAGNLAVWTAAKWLSGWTSDEAINRLRASFGLGPVRNALFAGDDRAIRVLLPVSPTVVPDAWRASVTMTGYWFLDEPDVEPDPELVRFVEGGEPPVVVSFGSMAGVDEAAVTRAVLGALQRTGRRAVLQAGWAKLGQDVALPANVLRTGYVPHGWLLPRASCLVHHGGAGTTAAAFRAGIPQVVVWHMGDQPYWAARVEALGAGPRRLFHRRLTAARLARRLARVVADPGIAERASALGARIRGEDGVAAAVRAIATAYAS